MRNCLRAGAICGLVAPFITYACILLAIASYAEFNWITNALSDLGIVPGATMIIFNGGLITGGILFLIFALVLVSFVGKDIVGRVGASILVLACIALISVGIFNEHFKPTHYLVSVALFVFLPISLLVLAGAFWRGGDKRFSVFTLAIGLAAAIPWVLQFTIHYVSHVAIPEFVSGLAGAIWVLSLSYNMLKESLSTKP